MVVYECRSLERLLSLREVAFRGGARDEAPPAEEDRQRVLAILSEADDPNYWFAASRDGNRAAHYRGVKDPGYIDSSAEGRGASAIYTLLGWRGFSLYFLYI